MQPSTPTRHANPLYRPLALGRRQQLPTGTALPGTARRRCPPGAQTCRCETGSSGQESPTRHSAERQAPSWLQAPCLCFKPPPKNAAEHQLESSEEEEEEARDCVTRGLCSPMGFGDRGAMAQPPRDRRDVGKVLPPRAENGQRSSLEWMERGRGRTGLLQPHRRALGTCPQTPRVPGGQEGNGCHSAPSPALADSSTGTLDPAGAASARSASQLPAGEGKSSVFLLKATPTPCHSSAHLRTLPCTGQDTGVSTLSPVSLQAELDSGTGED